MNPSELPEGLVAELLRLRRKTAALWQARDRLYQVVDAILHAHPVGTLLYWGGSHQYDDVWCSRCYSIDDASPYDGLTADHLTCSLSVDTGPERMERHPDGEQLRRLLVKIEKIARQLDKAQKRAHACVEYYLASGVNL